MMFFFFALLLFDPATYPNATGSKPDAFFTLPVVAIVIITVLNDGCILSIA